MKTEFKAITMHCNQEQFDAIKPKLWGFKIYDIVNFNHSKYLINNYENEPFSITNVSECNKNLYNGTVYEEWNEEIFLRHCGIETKEKQVDPVFVERYNITDKVKELLVECKKQGFSLGIDNGVIILKQI